MNECSTALKKNLFISQSETLVFFSKDSTGNSNGHLSPITEVFWVQCNVLTGLSGGQCITIMFYLDAGGRGCRKLTTKGLKASNISKS